jgi:hypothetical protein
MKKIIVILMFFILLPVLSPIGWIAAQDNNSTGAVTYSEEDGTPYYRAVFAHYLAVIPDPYQREGYDVNCAISISNVCAIPVDSNLDYSYGMGPGKARSSSGGFTIVLYDRDGTVFNFSSEEHYMVGHYGENHNGDGVLKPGQTFTVNLQEVLAAVKEVELGNEGEFVGYGWVLSKFDGLAGTYSNTIYGLGFTQAFELKPAMGQGGQYGGIMLPTIVNVD